VNSLKSLLLLTLCFNIIQATSAHADEQNKTVSPSQTAESTKTVEPINAEHRNARYISIAGGIFIPNEDGNISKPGLGNYANGYDVAISFGTKFNKYFTLESDLELYGSHTKHAIQSGGTSVTSTVTVFSTIISAIATLPLDSFDVFAGIGGGYYNDFMQTSSTTSGSSTAHSGAFGYQLLGGVDVNLSKRIAIRTEYKYVVNNPEFNFSTIGKHTVNFGGSIVNAGILFRY
jgi:opacity protein-like surface antigen